MGKHVTGAGGGGRKTADRLSQVPLVPGPGFPGQLQGGGVIRGPVLVPCEAARVQEALARVSRLRGS